MLSAFENYSVLILAGGNSNRMQSPKPWLNFENSTFLEHIIEEYKKSGLHHITVVLNQAFIGKQWKKEIERVREQVMIIENKEVEKGRLHSIRLGLEKMEAAKYTFIHNVDNPFVEKSVIDSLCLNALPLGVSIPVYREQKGHPVLISEKIKKEILENEQIGITLRDILQGFPQKKVVVASDSILKNINTPEDLKMSMSEYL